MKTVTERSIGRVFAEDDTAMCDVRKELLADEAERKRRDKKRVCRCPLCGRRPEIPFINAGRHIYTGHCEKCQARFTIHVID